MTSYKIPLSVPTLRGNEWRYIKECLDSNWVSYAGPLVERFEASLAAACGSEHAVATASGTAALHVALLIAGVKPDCEVLMPAISFVAPANAVAYCGAWPTFIDINADDWQLDVGKLAEFLARECDVRDATVVNRATGRRVAAILPVHLLGGMCDVDAIAELACRYRLPVVEDAAECVGATYKNRDIGSPSPSFVAPSRQVITSFNGNKIVTAGGGGAILVNEPKLAARARHLSTTAKADQLEFYHDELGYNYRMTNIAAALGLAQLEQLQGFVRAKRRTASRYAAAFQSVPRITVHPEAAAVRSTFWMYTIMIDTAARPVIEKLNASGIMARPIWIPLYRLPAFSVRCCKYRCVFADEFYRRALSLPCSTGIRDDELLETVSAVLRSL